MRVLSLILMLMIGLAGGWLLRDHLSNPVENSTAPGRPPASAPEPRETTDAESLIEAGDFHRAVERLDGDTRALTRLAQEVSRDTGLSLLGAFNDVYGERFDSVMAMAAIEADHGHFQAAVDFLLRAALLARTGAQETRLEHKLDEVTSAYARELIANERFEHLDSLYEMIVLALPEQAEYNLKLGRLRMRMGDFERALVPLSHIENDRQWGEQAREMMAQAEASEVLETPGRERLALRREGSQFVVEAMIDHGRSVDLLIDTGAAMTIIDADLLERLGYSFAGQRQEYFSTANGVVEAPVVTIGHLRLGGTGIKGLPVGALPLGLPNDIDGLLGMNFLRHYEFRIDQSGNALHLDTDH